MDKNWKFIMSCKMTRDFETIHTIMVQETEYYW